jgi:hypothetical protein
MTRGPDLRIARDEANGSATVCDGDRVLVGWQFAARFAIPHWFPLRTPSGKDLLVQHPDPYPHHRALWIADKVQLADGPIVDFYHCTKNQLDPDDPSKGYRHRICQQALPRCAAAGDRAVVDSELQWRIDGAPVLADARTFAVRALPGGDYLLDLAWMLRAAHGDVTFHSDQVHYGWPYLRVHPQFTPAHGGKLVDDVGRSGQQATNEQYANWVDYSNTIDGVTEGVAVFIPQDGSWRKWLTRDYGTFGPRRPDAQSGTKFTLPPGAQLAGSTRIFVHRGDAAAGNVAQRYREYVKETRR